MKFKYFFFSLSLSRICGSTQRPAHPRLHGPVNGVADLLLRLPPHEHPVQSEPHQEPRGRIGRQLLPQLRPALPPARHHARLLRQDQGSEGTLRVLVVIDSKTLKFLGPCTYTSTRRCWFGTGAPGERVLDARGHFEYSRLQQQLQQLRQLQTRHQGDRQSHEPRLPQERVCQAHVQRLEGLLRLSRTSSLSHYISMTSRFFLFFCCANLLLNCIKLHKYVCV